MKAIVQERYGPPEVLIAREVDTPVQGHAQVLVRVAAASVHLGDSILMSGRPYVMRFATGIRRPRTPVPGTDLSGTVVEVGEDVRGFRPGDAVFGWSDGAYAEYAGVDESQLALKPARLGWEQAAAIGVSATTALQLLRDDGKIQAGQKVLVNGASGGVGSFAVQIATALGAHVTGVTSTKNVDLVRSIGAHDVIDYTREDFTEGGRGYDLILDNVGNHSMARTRRALATNGLLISNGGGHAGGKLARTIRTMLASMIVRQQAAPSVKTQNRADLLALKELVEAGRITPVIDSSYPLEETADAIRRVATGHARGTVVITVDRDMDLPLTASSVAASSPQSTLADAPMPAIVASPPA